MKLPRSLVATLLYLSGFAVVTAAVSWWITWPNRTIRQFTAFLEQGQFDDANKLLAPPTRLLIEVNGSVKRVRVETGQPLTAPPWESLFSPESWQDWCTLENLQTDERSLAEIVRGRQRFSFTRKFTTARFIGGHAEQGQIVFRYENWAAH